MSETLELPNVEWKNYDVTRSFHYAGRLALSKAVSIINFNLSAGTISLETVQSELGTFYE